MPLPKETAIAPAPSPSPSPRADLRGAARLAVEATAGLTDLVEAMHQRIASLPGGTAADGRTSGITGLVYRSIRGVTRLVGGSLDALLGALQPLLAAGSTKGPPGPQREAIVAALNGVLGDHLAATHNPLATTMALRVAGVPLLLETAALRIRFPDPVQGGQLLVLVHGLCMNDLQWQREGHDHGTALARDAGFSPVWLHYNTGLPIARNGELFSALMQQLLDAWPHPLQRVVILAHSMGGLVARSALHQGAQQGLAWAQRVDDLVCLGTPHHGAPLERAGHGLDVILGAAPYAAPLARLGKLRSAGITDLRHGRVRPGDPEPATPLPAQVRCYTVAGTLGEGADSLKARLAGDGLVPLASALGRHKTLRRSLQFVPERQWVAAGVHHMALLSDAGVYAQLVHWLGSPASRVSTRPADAQAVDPATDQPVE